MKNQQVVLTSRPEGFPQAHNFTLRQTALPVCPSAGVLVKNLYASVDPAMRGWISAEKNYLEPVALQSVMRALAVGQVIESQNADHPLGSYVTGWFGWQQFAAAAPSQIIRSMHEFQNEADNSLPLSTALGVLGLNGITAYLALHNIGRPKPGDTLLVSTAAGAVGSIVGQLGKLAGCRVLGLTGSDNKVEQCLGEFGYDGAINYKTAADLSEAVAELLSSTPHNSQANAPSKTSTTDPDAQAAGVDIFFDHTGGHIGDAVWPHMNLNGRVVQCGTAAIERWQPLPQGPRKERYFITKRLLQQGFVAFDHLPQWPASVDALSQLIHAGKLHYREDIHRGLTQAPNALEALNRGDNLGKTIIEIEHI